MKQPTVTPSPAGPVITAGKVRIQCRPQLPIEFLIRAAQITAGPNVDASAAVTLYGETFAYVVMPGHLKAAGVLLEQLERRSPSSAVQLIADVVDAYTDDQIDWKAASLAELEAVKS